MQLEPLLIRYGVLAVFVFATVEGDLTLIVAGVVAHLGLFALSSAIVAGAAGNLVGDCAWYALGRWHAGRIRGGQLYRRFGSTVETLVRRLGVWELLACRVVYGTRNASMVFWGLQHLRFDRFLAVDAIGCLGWCAVFATLGYALSNSAAWLTGEVRRIELWLLGGVVVAALALIGVHWLARRRLHV